MDQAGGGGFGQAAATLLRDAEVCLGKAVLSPVWQLADGEVEASIEVLDRIEARAAVVRGALLVQAQERSLQARTGAPSTDRWLAERFRWSRSRARAAVAEAGRWRDRPVLADALGAGAVTAEQASAVAESLERIGRVPGLGAEERVAAAEFLVGQAEALGPRELTVVGRLLEETLTRAPSVDDPDDAEALRREQERAESQARRRERNGLRFGRARDGRCRVTLDLGPVGEAFARAWAKTAGRPAPGTDGMEDTREISERRGDALVELLARNAATPPAPPVDADHPAGPADTDHAGNDPDPGAGGDRLSFDDEPAAPGPAGRRGGISPVALLTLTVTLAELRAGLTGAGVLDGGATVSAATLRRLACDALVVPAVLGGPSEVLDLGRARRLHSPAQRRAIILRDRACIAPGCDRPPRDCHVHHDPPWEAGGPTDTAHGFLLCDVHHHRIHQQGWTIRLGRNGYPELIPPPSIDPEQRPRRHARFQLNHVIQRR